MIQKAGKQQVLARLAEGQKTDLVVRLHGGDGVAAWQRIGEVQRLDGWLIPAFTAVPVAHRRAWQRSLEGDFRAMAPLRIEFAACIDGDVLPFAVGAVRPVPCTQPALDVEVGGPRRVHSSWPRAA